MTDALTINITGPDETDVLHWEGMIKTLAAQVPDVLKPIVGIEHPGFPPKSPQCQPPELVVFPDALTARLAGFTIDGPDLTLQGHQNIRAWWPGLPEAALEVSYKRVTITAEVRLSSAHRLMLYHAQRADGATDFVWLEL